MIGVQDVGELMNDDVVEDRFRYEHERGIQCDVPAVRAAAPLRTQVLELYVAHPHIERRSVDLTNEYLESRQFAFGQEFPESAVEM